jgi:hypothetical protein
VVKIQDKIQTARKAFGERGADVETAGTSNDRNVDRWTNGRLMNAK